MKKTIESKKAVTDFSLRPTKSEHKVVRTIDLSQFATVKKVKREAQKLQQSLYNLREEQEEELRAQDREHEYKVRSKHITKKERKKNRKSFGNRPFKGLFKGLKL